MTSPAHPRLRSSLAWLLTLTWAGVIFSLSAQTYSASLSTWVLETLLAALHVHVSPGAFDTLHLLLRKSAHLTEYAILALLIYVSRETQHPHAWRTRTAVWAVLAAGLYSLTDEYHQSFVQGRGASLVDCGIDTVGAALGLLALYADLQLRRRDRTPPHRTSPTETKRELGAR